MSDQPTLADVYRRFEEIFERRLEGVKSHLDIIDELANEMRATKQRLIGLEHDARQPRLTMEADVPSDSKTCERVEGTAAAVQAEHGDSCSANQVNPDLMCLISFSDDSTRPPTLLCSRDDALVGNGAAAPKSYLSPLHIGTPKAAGGLLLAIIASTATRTTFDQPPLWFCPAEKNNMRTSKQYAMDCNIF